MLVLSQGGASRNILIIAMRRVTMKNMLLLLLALTVVPAWAAEAVIVPSAIQPQATQVAPETQSSWLNFLIKDSNAGALSCPSGCNMTHCPAITGPIVCCKNNVPC
jgi:hypothetical protein